MTHSTRDLTPEQKADAYIAKHFDELGIKNKTTFRQLFLAGFREALAAPATIVIHENTIIPENKPGSLKTIPIAGRDRLALESLRKQLYELDDLPHGKNRSYYLGFQNGYDAADARAKRLESALNRMLINFKLLLAQKPVRDATETIAEAESAIKQFEGEKEKA